jgi:hypothetical protein
MRDPDHDYEPTSVDLILLVVFGGIFVWVVHTLIPYAL